jgi:hypothetical protein
MNQKRAIQLLVKFYFVSLLVYRARSSHGVYHIHLGGTRFYPGPTIQTSGFRGFLQSPQTNYSLIYEIRSQPLSSTPLSIHFLAHFPYSETLLGRINRSLDMDRIQKTASNYSCSVACVFVAAGTCSPSRRIVVSFISSGSTVQAFRRHVTSHSNLMGGTHVTRSSHKSPFILSI